MWLGCVFLRFRFVLASASHYLSFFIVLVYALNFLGEEHAEHAEEHHH